MIIEHSVYVYFYIVLRIYMYTYTILLSCKNDTTEKNSTYIPIKINETRTIKFLCDLILMIITILQIVELHRDTQYVHD